MNNRRTLGAILREREDVNVLAMRQKLWSMRTFGGYERNAAGPAKHLVKEVQMELLAPLEQGGRPFDGGELADCFILWLDMLWRSGFDLETIIALAHRKMDANEKRSWPARPNGEAVEHDRAQTMSFEEVTFNALAEQANKRAWAFLKDAGASGILDPERLDEFKARITPPLGMLHEPLKVPEIIRDIFIPNALPDTDRNKRPADVDGNSPIEVKVDDAMDGTGVQALFVSGNSAVALIEDTDEQGSPRLRLADVDNLSEVVNSLPRQVSFEDALRCDHDDKHGCGSFRSMLGEPRYIIDEAIDNQGKVKSVVLGVERDVIPPPTFDEFKAQQERNAK